MKQAAICATLAAALYGCGLGPSLTRPMAMEFRTDAGRWRIEGVRRASLECVGWQVRIVDSAVGVDAPYVAGLVVEVVNTSGEFALTIPRGTAYLQAFGPERSYLGPPQDEVLQPGRSYVLRYSPGIRAPTLPAPFALHVVVRRDVPGAKDEEVTIHFQ